MKRLDVDLGTPSDIARNFPFVNSTRMICYPPRGVCLFRVYGVTVSQGGAFDGYVVL